MVSSVLNLHVSAAFYFSLRSTLHRGRQSGPVSLSICFCLSQCHTRTPEDRRQCLCIQRTKACAAVATGPRVLLFTATEARGGAAALWDYYTRMIDTTPWHHHPRHHHQHHWIWSIKQEYVLRFSTQSIQSLQAMIQQSCRKQVFEIGCKLNSSCTTGGLTVHPAQISWACRCIWLKFPAWEIQLIRSEGQHHDGHCRKPTDISVWGDRKSTRFTGTLILKHV